jgi:nucleoside-diphosphate-sugar epimerase
MNKENISFVSGDLADDEFFSHLGLDFDYVYHLAAVIGVRHVTSHPDRVLYVNAISTLKAV